VIHLDMHEVFQFYRRKEIWAIYFYKPENKKALDFEETYKQLAEKMYGVIKVGAINCQIDDALCEEFSVFNSPELLVF
jgi:DnaJ family protein C protein 16